MQSSAGQETSKTGTSLTVSLVGRVSVSADGKLVDEDRFPGRQGRLVFAYLAINERRPIPRDELADAIWADTRPATWEKALSVIISKLRALLAECGLDGASTLASAFGCYRLDLPAGSSVDILDARRSVDDPAASAADAVRAAEVAGTPFLPGDEGEWVESQRRELAEIRVRALERLTDSSLASSDYGGAAKLAQQVVELEPYRESGYRRLMQAHAGAGNRAEGLRVYERCRRFLADELGAYPSPETESVYRELLAAPAADSSEPAQPPAAQASSRWSRRRAGLLALGLLVLAAGIVALAVVTSGRHATVRPLTSDRCSPLDYGRDGDPDFLIAADLPLQRALLSFTRPMAEALSITLQQKHYRAGRFDIGLQVCDDATPASPLFSAPVCQANAREFVRNPSVIGVVGPFASGCAQAEIPILNQAGPLAVVSPSNTLVELTRRTSGRSRGPDRYYPSGRRNYARVIAPDDVQAAANAVLARKLGVRRVYLLDDGASYGITMATVFERTARRLRLPIVGHGTWDDGATSYASLAARIAGAHADGVFVAGASNENGAALLADLRTRLGPSVQIMLPDGFDPQETSTVAGRAAEGMTLSRPGVPNERLGLAGRRFAAAFSKRTGAPPTGFATHAAQALDVLLDAIARSDGTRASVAQNLFSTRISNGILGSFWITSTGDTTLNAITIFRIVGGKVSTYDTIMVPEDLLVAT
jgi:branched-chain amino acid transport system substrate-binding protein